MPSSDFGSTLNLKDRVTEGKLMRTRIGVPTILSLEGLSRFRKHYAPHHILPNEQNFGRIWQHRIKIIPKSFPPIPEEKPSTTQMYRAIYDMSGMW